MFNVILMNHKRPFKKKDVNYLSKNGGERDVFNNLFYTIPDGVFQTLYSRDQSGLGNL